jgi:hypothetical protein
MSLNLDLKVELIIDLIKSGSSWEIFTKNLKIIC